MVERLAAPPRCLNEDAQVVHDPVLADVLVEAARAQGGVQGVLIGDAARAELVRAAKRQAAEGGEAVLGDLAGHLAGYLAGYLIGYQVGGLKGHR